MNGGVVIKMNANQRYTSNPATTFALRRLAEMSGVPMQEFEVRNDSSCGSTVGTQDPIYTAIGAHRHYDLADRPCTVRQGIPNG